MNIQELYHVHLKNKYDKKWEVGKTIIFNKNYCNGMNQRLNRFSTYAGEMNYHDLLTLVYASIKDRTSISGEELEALKEILASGYELSYYANMFKRETALENCRRDNFPDLPSRLHSVYLTDKDSLEYWVDAIARDKEYEIYRVEAEDPFKTSELLIPNENLNYIDTYNYGYKYWTAKVRDLGNIEYLAQGPIKVLERVKK